MLSFIVETGTGSTDTTSYVTLQECEDYHSSYANSYSWDTTPENAIRTDDSKMTLLNRATQMIDTLNFCGYKTKTTQALEFPRIGIRDLMDNVIPRELKMATCEMAGIFGTNDRLQEGTVGIRQVSFFEGIDVSFDRYNPQAPLLPGYILKLLRRFTAPSIQVSYY